MPDQSTGRVAVVLVHGMGEQVPMETIRSFAEAVWTADPEIHSKRAAASGTKPGELFFVPDTRTGSRELMKISTHKSRDKIKPELDDSKGPVRTDFFEIYWADATKDNLA